MEVIARYSLRCYSAKRYDPKDKPVLSRQGEFGSKITIGGEYLRVLEV